MVRNLCDRVDERADVLIRRTDDLRLDEILRRLALTQFAERTERLLRSGIPEHLEALRRRRASTGKSVFARAAEHVLIDRVDDLPAPEDVRLLIDELPQSLRLLHRQSLVGQVAFLVVHAETREASRRGLRDRIRCGTVSEFLERAVEISSIGGELFALRGAYLVVEAAHVLLRGVCKVVDPLHDGHAVRFRRRGR